jgi:tetratricopeptide repeat protein 8
MHFCELTTRERIFEQCFLNMRDNVNVDPLWYAQSKFKRRRYDECIAICTELLAASRVPDKAVWLLKCAALTAKSWIDDTEMEEEGIAEALLDEHATASAPRPGTSLLGGGRRSGSGYGSNQGVRPVSASGRPLTGFARPGSSSRSSGRQGTAGRVGTAAFQTDRTGTARPLTALGRAVRLGTASMLSEPSGIFIDVDRLDLARYATRPHIAKALCDYLLYHDHNPRKALELAAKATAAAGFDDWWWKARLGKCYYQLGLLRDAERQFRSALRSAPRVETALELAKVYARLDQPPNVLECYRKVADAFEHACDPQLLTAQARLYEGVGDSDAAIAKYKEALALEPNCAEAMASLASHHFYSDEPEVAMRYYRRLLQCDPTMQRSVELWNNLGLCAFYASQHDMALPCMQVRAITRDARAGALAARRARTAPPLERVARRATALRTHSPTLARAFALLFPLAAARPLAARPRTRRGESRGRGGMA